MFFPTAEGLIGHVGRVSYILVTLIHPVKVEYFSLHAVARFFFKKWANPSLFFVYFCSFLVTISIQIEKSKDGVLGIRTWGHRMVGADKTMELCSHQQ